MVSILGQELCIFIDSRSTYSYISYKLAHRLRMEDEDLNVGLCVSTLIGDTMIANRVCRNYEIGIGKVRLRVDLVIIPLRDFDLILGIDWLFEHHILMNCFTRKVKIFFLGQPVVMIHGEK